MDTVDGRENVTPLVPLEVREVILLSDGGESDVRELDTVAVVTAVVVFGGLIIDGRDEPSARMVRLEDVDTLRRVLLLSGETELLLPFLNKDSDGRVGRDGATDTDVNARVRVPKL